MIDHVSNSQMRTFERCQVAWEFSYIKGIKGKPRAAATRGRVVHSSIARNLLQKIESEQDLPEDDVLDFFVDEFKEESHDTWWQPGEDQDKVMDAGVRMLQLYHQDVAPETRPIDVEQRFKLDISWKEGEEEKQVEFQGILDLLAQDGLHEIKTIGQTPREPKPDHILQMTGYWVGKESLAGASPTNGRFDYLVALKKAKIVSFPFVPTAGQKRFFVNQVPRVARAMESGHYYPNRANFLCKKDWCFYYDLCHEEYG